MTENLGVRLDRQAAAIKRLRADRDALLARIEALEAHVLNRAGSASPSTAASDGAAYVPRPECPMCGGPREAGRTTMTCAACSARRNKIIRERLDRTPIIRDSCFHCGTGFKPSTRFLCPTCSAAHKTWAESNK